MQKIKLIIITLCVLVNSIAYNSHVFAAAQTPLHRYHSFKKKYARLIIHGKCIECLAKSTYFLSLLDQQNYSYLIDNRCNEKECIQIDSTYFFHPHIQSCIQKMNTTQSLKPIISLLQATLYNYFHYDEPLIHELLILVFTIHKQVLLEKYTAQPRTLKTLNLTTILEISERINQLPIAEILNAIDMLVTELPPFLEKYEFNSQISWKDWGKKYWWVPPIFGGWFILKVLLSLQRPHYYFSPYLSSRPTIPLPPITTNDPVLAEIIVDKNKNNIQNAAHQKS